MATIAAQRDWRPIYPETPPSQGCAAPRPAVNSLSLARNEETESGSPILSRPATDWLSAARQQVGQLGLAAVKIQYCRERGWPVPALRATSNAKEILDTWAAHGLPGPDLIGPSAEGGVALRFERPGRWVVIEADNDGELVVHKQDLVGREWEAWLIGEPQDDEEDRRPLGASLAALGEFLQGQPYRA